MVIMLIILALIISSRMLVSYCYHEYDCDHSYHQHHPVGAGVPSQMFGVHLNNGSSGHKE